LVTKSTKIDLAFRNLGRRAVALFFAPEASCYYTEILWTDGRFLHYIVSTSALHAKVFEKYQR